MERGREVLEGSNNFCAHAANKHCACSTTEACPGTDSKSTNSLCTHNHTVCHSLLGVGWAAHARLSCACGLIHMVATVVTSLDGWPAAVALLAWQVEPTTLAAAGGVRLGRQLGA